MKQPLDLPPDLARLGTPPEGLVAYRGALRLFGTRGRELPSLDRWNSAEGWRREYRDLAVGLTFFAEDAFGNQFAWDGTRVVLFTAETGATLELGPTSHVWAERIADDQDAWLSRWLVEAWVGHNGPVPHTSHLAPRVPFSLGFEPTVEGLFVVDMHQDMVFKGQLAWRLKDAPPGMGVAFRRGE
jgi:hypothetical protein